MKDETKTAILTAVLMIGLIIIFKNVIYKPLNVVPLYLIPVFLYIGYITRRVGANLWIGMTLFITLAMAVLHAFF
ncbi:hypothetical protein KJA16_00095 [Patescibacteria group bacterium]|nr:hypothetical protein [Patescibacteria group bacterium]